MKLYIGKSFSKAVDSRLHYNSRRHAGDAAERLIREAFIRDPSSTDEEITVYNPQGCRIGVCRAQKNNTSITFYWETRVGAGKDWISLKKEVPNDSFKNFELSVAKATETSAIDWQFLHNGVSATSNFNSILSAIGLLDYVREKLVAEADKFQNKRGEDL